MQFVNLTPHTITFFVGDGVRIDVPPSGQVARVAVTKEKIDEVKVGEFTLPVFKSTFGEVENMPEPQEGVIFIVSALVAQALKGKRNDVCIVDDTVRDENGRIIGARALAVI